MLHDVDLSILISGPDKDKLKTISRGEVTTAKVHSATISVPPVFLFVTSNQHLMDHTFSTEQKSGFGSRKNYESNVNLKGSIPGDVKAVRNRFLEVFVRRRPQIPLEVLPSYGSYSRKNFIVGTFKFILKILFSYKKDDFPSPYLFLYPICGLAKNVNLIPEIFKKDYIENIMKLVDHYEFAPEEKCQILNNLPQ